MATPEIKSRAELESKIIGDPNLNKLRESVKAEVDSQRKLTAYKDFLKAFDPIKSPEGHGMFRINIDGTQYDIAESILDEDAQDILQMQDVDLKAIENAGQLSFEIVTAATKNELSPLKDQLTNSPDLAKQQEMQETLQKAIDEQKNLKEQFEKLLVNNTPTDAQADVQKLLDLSNALQTGLISRDATFAGAMAANASAALQEQNEYLRNVIAGYEADPKFKAPKFKPNKRIAKDMQRLVDQFGTPAQKLSFANMLDPNLLDAHPDNKEVEKTSKKTVIEMSETEKVITLKNLIAGLDGAMTNKKQTVDATTGETYIDLNKDEYDQFVLLNTLTAVSNDGKPDANEVYDRNMSVRERKRTIKKLEKDVSSEQKKGRDMKKIAGLEEQNAKLKNDVNYFTNRANITHGITEVLKTGKYLGQTIEYQPRSPLFMNICQSLDAFSVKGVIQINFAGNPNVLVRCPEMVNGFAGTYVDQFGKRFASREDAQYCQENGVHTPNILETFFLKNTKMTPEQARKNASLLSTGGLLAGLFFGIKWLVSKDASGKTNFMGRAAIIAGSLLGVNMLSQGLTGKPAGDFIKDIWSGKLSLSDLMAGKGLGVEVRSPQLTTASVALNGIPYGVLSTVSKEGSNGNPTINFDLLEKSIETKILISTGEEKEKLQQQLDAVKNLHKDPKGQQYIDQALTDLGIKQKDITAPENKDKTIDAKVDEAQERVRKLTAYEQEKHLKLISDRDPSYISYFSTGKPSLDELAAAGKFKADISKPGVDNVSEAQRKIDQELAQAGLPDDVALRLDDAMNKVNGTIDFKVANNRPTFLFENGKLYIRSYGLNTPVAIKEGNYRVGTLDIPLTGEQEAIKTANLVNFLIMSNNGQWDNEAPYAFAGKDITVGNKSLFGRGRLDNKLSGLKQKYFNTTAVDGPDFKLRPWGSSTLDHIGGTNLSSQGGKFAEYLNGLKNTRGQSIWKTGQGISSTSEILGFAAGLGTLPKSKIDNTASDNTNSAPEKTTPKKKKKSSSSNNSSSKSTSNNKASETAVISADKAKSWKEKYKIKDVAGKELPEEFYKTWIEAANNKQKLFVYGGEVYDREPRTSKPAHLVPKADIPEEVTARAAAKAAGKEFMNRREALIAGNVTCATDNTDNLVLKSGFEWVGTAGVYNFAVVKASANSVPDNKDVLSIDETGLKSYEKALNTYLPTLSAKPIEGTNWLFTVSADKKSKHMKLYAFDKLLLGDIEPSDYAGAGDTLNKDGVNKKVEALVKLRINNFNLVNAIKSKIYTCEQLFNTPLESQPVWIQNFFNKAKTTSGDPGVRIDSRDQYTSLKDNGDIEYSFNFDGSNDPGWINNITYQNYVTPFTETDFKKILKDKVTELAKAHQGDSY